MLNNRKRNIPKIKEAIILVGGKGTRLSSLVKDVPKPMAPINNNPFLLYLVKYLKFQGIERIIFATEYKNEVIKSFFKEKYLDIDICYSLEEKPLGTGGAVKKSLKLVKGEKSFIINGDTFFNINLHEMAKVNSDIVIGGKFLLNYDRYGTIIFDDNYNIISFEEKKETKQGYINGGVYILKNNILDSVYNDEVKFSLESDFFEKNIHNKNMKIFKSKEYFIDIGIPKDYIKAKEYFKDEENTFLR